MIKPGYGSHLPILIKAFLLTGGNILECGTGYNSTPVLHWLSIYFDRKLYSYENNKEFFILNKGYRNTRHSVEFVKNWTEIKFKRYGLAFIDCRPALTRKEIVKRIHNRANMIILHDTQEKKKATYKYDSIYPLFEYIYHAGPPYNTSVLSNTINVKDEFEIKEPF